MTITFEYFYNFINSVNYQFSDNRLNNFMKIQNIRAAARRKSFIEKMIFPYPGRLYVNFA